MKQPYLLYIHDILEVCPLIFKVVWRFVTQTASLVSPSVSRSLSTPTNLLLRTNDNTSNMENKE